MQALPAALIRGTPQPLPVPVHPEPQLQRRARAILDRSCKVIGAPLLAATSPDDLEGQVDVLLGDTRVRDDFDALTLALPHLPDDGTAVDLVAILGERGAELFVRAGQLASVLSRVAAQQETEHPVLQLGVADVYRNHAPPPEVMELVLRNARVQPALVAVAEAMRQGQPLPSWLGEHLAEMIRAGHEARLVLMASAGLRVPEEVVPLDARLELSTLETRAAEVYRRWEEEAHQLVVSRQRQAEG